MVQTYSQLLATCEQYNSLFLENELCLLQKAYTTPHFLILSLRFPGKTVILYVGRGNQYQGLYLYEKLPPSHLRIQDRFLDYIRKHLVGARLSKIICQKNKMLLSFEFKREGETKTFYLGWSDRHLYFDQKMLDENLSFAIPNEDAKTRASWSIEDYLKKNAFDECKKLVQKKKEKFLLKKIENIKKDIEKNERWRAIEEKLKALEIDLSSTEVVVCGEKIKFLNSKNDWQKKDLIFKKIKKLKRGEEILLERLKESEKDLASTKSGAVKFEYTKESAISPCWPSQKSSLGKTKVASNIKKIKIKEIDGLVGLDSSGNDSIRNSQSKEYYWFHLENLKGAHCIIKTDDIARLSQIDLAAIASMLRDLSHLEILEIPILFTQLKNVKGIKGSPGMVSVKKAKHLRCNYTDWTEIISILGP